MPSQPFCPCCIVFHAFSSFVLAQILLIFELELIATKGKDADEVIASSTAVAIHESAPEVPLFAMTKV